MASPKNPTEIARETIKLLAARRTSPTPENYQKIYCEVAGVPPKVESGGADEALQNVLHDLGKKKPELNRVLKPLEKALAERNWEGFESAFLGLAGAAQSKGKDSWAELIREMLKQWELKHSGVSAKRKREGLERVLVNFGSDPEKLHAKIQSLVKSWSEAPEQIGVEVDAEIAPASEAVAEAVAGARATARGEFAAAEPAVGDTHRQLRELVAQSLEQGVIPRLTQFPDLVAEADQLAQQARQSANAKALEKFSKALKQFWFKLEVRGESDADVLAGLLRLLKLLVDNIGELVIDDQWLSGQMAVVQEVISQPVSARMLYDAERSFKEVIFKQSALKTSLSEARATLKSMIATFIDRVGEMSASTGEYHAKIEGYSERIGKTEDVHQINDILADLSKDMRGAQLDMQRLRDELIEARHKVEAAEQKILALEAELEQVSTLVHEDQLTGTLNRRGMEDAFQRELARADRVKSALCVALLDVDNFKKLNDTLGHQAGDEALLHLVSVVKETLRPMDIIARFGGEEFVIILPDAGLDEAITVMTRLQRELTKKFFLYKNQRVLITFSAGVALRESGEIPNSMIERADRAVYKAKEAGRNLVLAAEPRPADTGAAANSSPPPAQ
jgi:diguanylate cyclase